MHSQLGSTANLIEQGPSVPAILSLGTGIRLESDGQTTTLAAVVRLRGIGGASAELTDLYAYTVQAPIGSAQLSDEIDKVTVDLMGAIPSALRAVAEELPRSADSRVESQ